MYLLMSSHKVHKLVGEIICGFSSVEIDDFIDRRHLHDIGRRDCEKLLRQVSEIYNRHGEKGLCYYILHNYLDKIESIVRGRSIRLFSSTRYAGIPLKERFKHLPTEVRKGLLDEVSTLSYIDGIWDPIRTLGSNIYWLKEAIGEARDPYAYLVITRYFYYKEYTKRGYSKHTAKKKAEGMARVFMSCVDQDYLNLPLLRHQVRSVRLKLLDDLERVLCIMFEVDRKKWIEWWGEELHDHILNIMVCKDRLKDVKGLQ